MNCKFISWLLLGMNLKREYASGEGSLKRQKLMSGASSAPSSTEKLFDSRIDELIETIVLSTDKWPSQLLESLFSILEHTIEGNGDLCATVNEYITHYEELMQAKMNDRKEDWSAISLESFFFRLSIVLVTSISVLRRND